MVAPAWVPRRGEIIHLDDSGGAGHEQTGDRPHLVLTQQGYNDKLSLVVCVPITSVIKNSPFEHPISGLPKRSVALTHQVTTADWRRRNAFSKGMADKAEFDHVLAKIAALLGLVYR